VALWRLVGWARSRRGRGGRALRGGRGDEGGGRWLLRMMMGAAAAAADTGEGRGRGQGGGGRRSGGHGTQVGPGGRVKVPRVRGCDLGVVDLGRRREGGRRGHGRGRRSSHAVGASALSTDKVKVLRRIEIVGVWFRGHGCGCGCVAVLCVWCMRNGVRALLLSLGEATSQGGLDDDAGIQMPLAERLVPSPGTLQNAVSSSFTIVP